MLCYLLFYWTLINRRTNKGIRDGDIKGMGDVSKQYKLDFSVI